MARATFAWLAAAAALVALLASGASAASPYRVQAQALVAQMTQEEKLSLVHGWPGSYVGNVPAIERLGLPALNLEDGPQGVSDGVTQVTAWPSALTVVASWDVGAMELFASAMALEERAKGTNIHLAPMVNIARVPVGGRNFESFGEDPALAAAMVRASVSGIQSQGVIATVKHFVDNNQEDNRTLTSANVPQRAQWEIYYPAFNAAVAAGVGAVMCSYNLINNTYACENPQTLADLKERMGFEGFVMSDWGATHSTVPAANAGLDMQMPDDSYFGAALAAAVAAGNVSQARLDDMATRIVTALYMVGLVNRTEPTGNLSLNVQTTAHAELAQQLAEAGTVLVQNNASFLPLSLRSLTTIAVLGDDGNKSCTVVGGGSGSVIPPYIVTPLAAIQQLVGPGVKVLYAPTKPASAAAALAAQADVAVVFVATDSHEGADRTDLSLGSSQDALVAAVAAKQPNTAVVVHTPGAAFMPWAAAVKSVLVAFMPGQMDGAAIANVLFGARNPSGRLPLTFPAAWPNAWPTPAQYPGIDNEAAYSEGLLVGYRWYDANAVAPLFPFGHGLSYTTFAYSGIKIAPAAGTFTFSFTLANTGARDGAEVPQLYIGYPASAGEPPRVLRAFSNVLLQAGAATKVSWQLGQADLAVWNVTASDWSVVHGTFTAYVGASSRDFRLQATFTN